MGERLLPFLPTPIVGKDADGSYRWLNKKDLPHSIGRLFLMGNAGVLLRAYFYAAVLGREGLHRVGEYSTLNANYLMHK